MPPENRSLPPMGAAEWGMLLLLSVLWGGSFFFVEVALTALPPCSLVVLRVGLAAGALQAVVRVRGDRSPAAGRLWPAFLIMGLLNNALPFSLIIWGQTRIDGGLAAILNATTPFFALLLARLLAADEGLGRRGAAGLGLGLVGVVVIVGPSALRGLGAEGAAQAAVVAAALSYAGAGVYGRRFARFGVTPLQTAAGQTAAATLLLGPVALAVDRPWTLAMPGVAVILAVLGLAVASTAVAYVLYFRILKTAGATNLLLVTLLIPASALLLGAAALGERPAAGALGGLAVIGLGLAVLDGRPVRRMTQALLCVLRMARKFFRCR